LETFDILENWLLRRGGGLREVVATGGLTVVQVFKIVHRHENQKKKKPINFAFKMFCMNQGKIINYILHTSFIDFPQLGFS